MSVNEKLELHHRLKDKKNNRKLFPLQIDSILNLVLLHVNCHANNRSFMKIQPYEVAKRRENFLQRNKKICDFVNDPVDKIDV